MDGPGAVQPAGAQFHTFLFSDIEGSTRLLQALGDAAPAVIGQHHAILRGAIEATGGTVRRTEGDAFFATYEAPAEALEGAVSVQRALRDHAWPEGGRVHVRIGMHSGVAVLVDGDEFIGLDVHRAARIMSVGWGDQILLSEATALLLDGHTGAPRLRDLGLHRLKDLDAPQRLFQAVADDLRTDFPAVRSLDAVPHNLPVQLTSFVGRGAQLAEVGELLERSRILTLTGPGGTGKTRLSLQVAAEAADRFPDGVTFVALAGTTDPILVMSVVAETLGLVDRGTQTPLEIVAEHLATRTALLVLDNFEQVLDAAPDVSKLVAQAPGLSVLVSSRAPLRVSGEQVYPVPPLQVPGPPSSDVVDVASSEAAQLFVTRAAEARPDFALTPENASAVSTITRRLDGLPLAIELAAARVRVLPVDAIADRLGAVLDLLSGGSRDLTDRQRTLRGAIAWSHDLLEEGERRLFARLAVFRGGAELDHLEQVCGPGLDDDVFDLLSVLVDHSLVRRPDARGTRFTMLETIREFADEQLEASGEAAELRQRHRAAFLSLAEEAAPHLTSAGSGDWLDRLEIDHDNIRAALRRACSDADPLTALRLAAALWRMWQIRGHLSEGRREIDAVLGRDDLAAHPDALAAALEAAGGISYWQADLVASRGYYARALELYRGFGDDAGEARGLYNLAFSHGPTEAAESIAAFQLALAAYERVGEADGVARGHWGMTVGSLWVREFEDVAAHAAACIPVFRERGHVFDLAWALHSGGLGEFGLGRYDEARALWLEAMDLFVDADDVSGYYMVLADFGFLAEARGDPARALRIFGAVERLGEEVGSALLDNQWDLLPRLVRADDQVDESTAAELRAEGRRMTRADAIAYALATT